MIESRTLLQIFESKLEETARLFFSNSAITVDLVTIIYNLFFWGLAIPAVIYLIRVERIEDWSLSDFLASESDFLHQFVGLRAESQQIFEARKLVVLSSVHTQTTIKEALPDLAYLLLSPCLNKPHYCFFWGFFLSN